MQKKKKKKITVSLWECSECLTWGYWVLLAGHQWGTPMRASCGPHALKRSFITRLRHHWGRTLSCRVLSFHSSTSSQSSCWHMTVGSAKMFISSNMNPDVASVSACHSCSPRQTVEMLSGFVWILQILKSLKVKGVESASTYIFCARIEINVVLIFFDTK